ncbi:MAG: inositol monophosphatase family protein, partial [SAR324 cluster bacterium]|nr:inositol monophosphatase family protein [SAR324 cluster bacterium]
MTTNETSLKELLQFAHRLADAAEESILSRFRSKLTVEDKTDSSPVTIADREAEQEMRNLIQSLFPDHGIIGEEHGEMNPNSPLQWVLDPIDGTRAFITGNPLFGTLIGLMEQGNPRLGVINIPATGERWTSAEGLNCHYQN